MSDVEVDDLFAYLKSVPGEKTGETQQRSNQ